LHFKRHASTTLSGERIGFDPLAGEALLRPRASISALGSNAARGREELLAGAGWRRRRRTAELG
jgi:hypothetical protein